MAAQKEPSYKPGPVTPGPDIPITYIGPGPAVGDGESDYTKPSDILDPPPYQSGPTNPNTLNQTAPRDIRLAVTAEGAVINWLYGPVKADKKIFAVGTSGKYLVLGLMWGKGECEAIQTVYANKDVLTPNVQVRNYTGTAGQGVDSWLSSAISGFSDPMPGICYSVVKISQEDYTSMPSLTAVIQGRKIYDPRSTLTAYTTNPALFFRDAAILGGLDVDDVSIEATADACDALITTVKRREAGVVFDKPLSLDAILDTLAAYAGGLYVREGGVAKLIPNRPASVTSSFTDDETDATRLKILDGTFKIKKLSTENLPNRVICQYTDTTRTPWGRAYAATSVPTGDIRSTRLTMPGIQSYAQARREAIERHNYYTLTDLECQFVAFDEALKMEVGDVFDVVHRDGFAVGSPKQFRCTGIKKGRRIGLWAISGREYDPGVYSDEELDDPTFNDTTLPDPAAVPDAPVPSLIETNYQLQNQTWATRIEASWAALTDYPYRHEFEVLAYIGSSLIWTVRSTGLEAVMGPLQEGQTYTIDLYVVGVGGIKGSKGSANLLAVGKSLPPDFPGGAQLRGNEAGGRVFLNWDAANDDIWNYEVRFGSSGQTWAAMTVLTQTDSLWYTAETIPTGTWDIKVKAIDSVGVYSSNELTLTGLEVTSDADSYAQTDATVAVDSVTNMTLQGNDYLPDDGTSWNTLFPNAMNTYTEPLVTYGGSFTTEVISDEHDLGAIVSANFQFATNVELLVGEVDYLMQVSDTPGGPYTDFTVLSANTSGRYARLKVTGLLTDRFILRPEYFHLTALVNTLNKEGEGTSSATLATTITLDAEYSKVVTIQITPISSGGAEDLTGVPDNIVLGPGNTKFDVYIFQGGSQVARDFYYTARVIK